MSRLRPELSTLERALSLLGVLALSLLHASAAEPAASVALLRDWARYPAVRQIRTAADIYAVGDVHGDYERLVELLATNRIIATCPARPEAAKWAAGGAYLVCTGDLIDRWTNGIAAIRLFQCLQPQARQAGGDVIVTMGNHEAEFLSDGGDHHRTQEFEWELRAAQLDPEVVRAGADSLGIGQFLRSLPIVAVMNDWCFVHAGNFQGLSLAQVDRDLQQTISQQGFGAPILSNPDSLLEARLQPRPWWEHGTHTPSEAEAHLRDALAALPSQHLVTGHQPKGVVFADGTKRPAGAIWCEFNGLLFLIDVGMSRGFGLSHGALLWIQTARNKAVALSATGQATELWDGTARASADHQAIP